MDFVLLQASFVGGVCWIIFFFKDGKYSQAKKALWTSDLNQSQEFPL